MENIAFYERLNTTWISCRNADSKCAFYGGRNAKTAFLWGRNAKSKNRLEIMENECEISALQDM